MYLNRLYRELPLITRVLQMGWIQSTHTVQTSISFLTCLSVKKKHLHSLILIHHWFFFTKNELFLAQKLGAQLFFF